MAFFLSTKGQIHPYKFTYLEGKFAKLRLQPTIIHNAETVAAPKVSSLEDKDFYAIDVMNKPVFTMPHSALLKEIREEMKKRNIRHVPLLENKKLAGIVSDRDLLKVDLSGPFLFLKGHDIMATILVVTDEETPLAHIAKVLIEEKISALPVIDKTHQFLVGFISRTDILKAVISNRLVLR